MRVHPGPFTLEDRIAEVKLELLLRVSTYAKLVRAGRMRQDVSDFRMGRMQSVLDGLLEDQREAEERRRAAEDQGELPLR